MVEPPRPSSTYAVRGNLAIGGELARGAVVVEGERIAAVVSDPRDGALPETVIDAAIVAPGLIDLQVNGGFGVDVGMDPEAIRRLAARLPATGVTAFLPTVISSPPAEYQRVFEAFGRRPPHRARAHSVSTSKARSSHRLGPGPTAAT